MYARYPCGRRGWTQSRSWLSQTRSMPPRPRSSRQSCSGIRHPSLIIRGVRSPLHVRRRDDAGGGSRLWWRVTPSPGLLLPNSEDQRPVHVQGGGRGPARRSQPDHPHPVPPEVFDPPLGSWVEDRGVNPRLRVGRRLPGPLAQGARYAGQGEVVECGRAVGSARDDVIDVERGFLSELGQAAVSHRFPARWTTWRARAAGMSLIRRPARPGGAGG
jgi:hypothetical protein